MSDVTAVVLTLGEETTARALRSVEEQSLAPAEIIVIADTVPFHAALNRGAARVKSAYFVQVDSDMVLDEHCFQLLRQCMVPGVGVAAGHLRDPLVGRACCVKMFRRECFDRVQFKDSISPDTDFIRDIAQHGWSLVYALRFDHDAKPLWHTFGEHDPGYTPEYTFVKYVMEGGRYRHRGDLGGLLWHLRQLRNSSHSAALLAQIALAHGVFSAEEKDLLGSATASADLDFLLGFLTRVDTGDVRMPDVLPRLTSRPRDVLNKFCLLGIDLRKRGSTQELRYCMNVLADSGHKLAWVAQVGLCHGLLSQSYHPERFDEDYQRLLRLLSGQGVPATKPRGIRGLFRLLRDRRGSVGIMARGEHEPACDRE